MKLNLGCGKNWREYLSFEGLDIVDFGQKYIHDLLSVPWPIEKNSVDEIMCHNTLEHVAPKDLIPVMNECNRVLKDGGVLDIIVPKFPMSNAVSDPTHKSMWKVEKIEGEDVNIFIFWGDEDVSFWNRQSFDYWAGKRPRNADYGMQKWAVENDGKGNYTTKIEKEQIHIRLIKGRQK